jgi:hypothetical protein
MKIFAVKFEYDNGWKKDSQICLVVAEKESQAIEKFEEKIYNIFDNYDDDCYFTSVKEVQDSDIIFLHNGFMWTVSNDETPMKMVW